MVFDTANRSPGVYVLEENSAAPIAGVGTSTAAFIGVIETGVVETVSAASDSSPATSRKSKGGAAGDAPSSGQAEISMQTASSTLQAKTNLASPKTDLAQPQEVKLCTNFTEFKKFFGDFSNHSGQSNLAHAVFGFFRNGGTRCYVVGVSIESEKEVKEALEQFEAIDEIAIVAAPGMLTVRGAVIEHCSMMQDRVAILDSPAQVDLAATNIATAVKPANAESDYAALYFPWLLVFDPASDPKQPNKNKPVPPSGHIAGIYARVDGQRGVFKAPANEVVMGVVGLAQPVSKRNQDGLNPIGINCIRDFNGTIRVWGARTLDVDSQFRYISTRRLFNYLRESIDEGTQWTVFEPNSPELWARIRRNVTAFLTVVWRSGALFGNTPEEAFYVKCDAENNPPELRDLGQVNIDIGVAVVKPAEFVIFKLQQWSGPGGN